MAEKTADLISRRLGGSPRCRTHTDPLPEAEAGKWTSPGMASALFAAARGVSTVQVGIPGEILFASGLIDLMGVHPVEKRRLWRNPWSAISAPGTTGPGAGTAGDPGPAGRRRDPPAERCKGVGVSCDFWY
jgi:hypothetical protein